MELEFSEVVCCSGHVFSVCGVLDMVSVERLKVMKRVIYRVVGCREGGRAYVSVCARVCVRESMCVHTCVCVCERESEHVCVCKHVCERAGCE